MRVARGKAFKGRLEPVEELAEFMNFNLSHQALYQPQLRGKAATGESGIELIIGEKGEYRTTPPLSVEQFIEAFSKLTCFESRSRMSSDSAVAAEACCVQKALEFILHPLVTAKTAYDIALSARRVAEFLNRDSWFECNSSVREYFGYLSRERFFSEGSSRPYETGWREWVEESLPPMRWRIEPILESSGKLKGWKVNPYANTLELYPIAITLLAEAATQGNLLELKQCAWEKCRKFFVLKSQPGTRASFCTDDCRISYYNFQRSSEERVATMYKAMLRLAKKPNPLTKEQMHRIEAYMGFEQFEKLKCRLRSGIVRPKISDEIRERFKAPRPRGHNAQHCGGFEEVKLLNADWRNGKLMFHLSRVPEKAWVARFQSLQGIPVFVRAAPANFVFEERTAWIVWDEPNDTIPSDDPTDRNTIVQQFKRFLAITNHQYQQQLASLGKRRSK